MMLHLMTTVMSHQVPHVPGAEVVGKPSPRLRVAEEAGEDVVEEDGVAEERLLMPKVTLLLLAATAATIRVHLQDQALAPDLPVPARARRAVRPFGPAPV